MRAAWASGANYDRSDLEFATASPGFVLGESLLGDPLGADGVYTPLAADFTSMSIVSPCAVEDGLFVHREVETCNLTATLPDMVELEGLRLRVTYQGVVVFAGTVRQSSWVEIIDTRGEHMAGNVGVKSYRVSLVATSGEEAFARAATPPRNFNNVSSANRLGSWLGATVDIADAAPAADIDGPLLDNTRAAVSDRRLQYASDTYSNLLDEMRDQLRLTNLHYRFDPSGPAVRVIANSRWLGGTDEASALRFTDDPASDTQTGGGAYTHADRTVSYTSRQVGSDPSMFVKGVTVTVTDSSEVETTYGPFRATNAYAEDVDIDVGRNSLAGEELARAWAATLPLRIKSRPFTQTLSMPLQSTKQLGETGSGPGMALLEADGVTERIAVLGVTHTVTPTRWTVEYECGPEHLISRRSQLDPYAVTDLAVAQVSSGPPGVQFDWTTPDLPGGQMFYVIADVTTALPLTSWSIPYGSVGGVAAAPGTPMSIFVSGPIALPGVHTYAVFYTSDPIPGFNPMDLSYRQGQPAFHTITLT